MIVRRAAPGDMPYLVPLVVKAHAAYRMRVPFVRTLKQLTAALGNIATVLLVAEDEGNLQGFVWGEVMEDGGFFLHHVYGPHIGPILREAIAKEARAAGCHRIEGITSRSPMGFIEKYGAEIIGYLLSKEI